MIPVNTFLLALAALILSSAATSGQPVEVAPVATGSNPGGSTAAGAAATGANSASLPGTGAAPMLGGLGVGSVQSAPKVESVGVQPAASAVLPHSAVSAEKPEPVVETPVHERPPAGKPQAPSAGETLGESSRDIGRSKADASAGGDELAVQQALDRVFDAAAAAPALRVSGGVAGRMQDLRSSVSRKISIANTSPPADAPALYQDAIKTAQDALPAADAAKIAGVVKEFAALKAGFALGDLAASAYKAAAAGSKKETGRLLAAFDKWESLLGAPGKPLIDNIAVLKADVRGMLEKSSAGAPPSSVPHVWFSRKGGVFTAALPGSGVAEIPSLSAAFLLKDAAFAPIPALSAAYRAFASDPRASNGAGLVYRARRALGSSVPAAAASAGRFWLRSVLGALWRRVVALFRGAPSYDLSRRDGLDALRRDAAFARIARGESAAAGRRFAAARLTVADAHAAFAAAGRAAAALDILDGDGVAVPIQDLRRRFEAEAAARSLRLEDEVPSDLAGLLVGSGGLAHWAALTSERAGRRVSGDSLRRAPEGLVNLGASGGAAVAAAALARELAGPASFVALDERLWAFGRGPHGGARLAADLRATGSGGSIELLVERGDQALARRLGSLGFAVFRDGAGLRAALGPGDFSRDAGEIAFLAARALSAALGKGEEPLPLESAPAAAREVLALELEVKRDSASAAELAGLLDGKEAFAQAAVVGFVGAYEALAPTSVSLGGRPLLVSALRDPDTGLLAYALAAHPDGAPLGAAELRALLRAQ